MMNFSPVKDCIQKFLLIGFLCLLSSACVLHRPPKKPAVSSTTTPSTLSASPSADALLAKLKTRMQHPHTSVPKAKASDNQQGDSLSTHEPTVPPSPRLMDEINPSSGVKGNGNIRYLFISTANPKDKLQTPTVSPAFTDAYDKTLDMVRAGNKDKALQKMQNLSLQNPFYSGPLVNEGLIYMQLGKYRSALKTLEASVQINPKNPYAWNALGVSLRHEGFFDDARKSYEQALKLDPNYARAHFNLGVLAELYLQDLPLALKHYQLYQSLQITPDPIVNHWIIDLARRTGVHIPIPAANNPPTAAVQPSTAP